MRPELIVDVGEVYQVGMGESQGGTDERYIKTCLLLKHSAGFTKMS